MQDRREKLFTIKGRIITCENDEVIENGIIAVKKDKIVFVGRENQWDKAGYEEIKFKEDVTIMPGFIDCHTHITGRESGTYGFGKANNYDRLINATNHMEILLNAGFTTIRDMGIFGPALKRGVERGKLKGPKVFPGGRVLGITAGHSDSNTYLSKEYLKEEDPIGYLVDGVDGCLKGVREQFRIGAQFIKICATGGVSSMSDALDDVQFSMEELKVIVEETRRQGTYVAAHCSGTEGTYQSLLAGVTSIEHGIKLDNRCIELMVKNDATLVPTISISLGFPTYKGLPDYMVEKGMEGIEYHLKSIEMARKANIKIAYGTDFSNSENTSYKNNGKEFVSLVKAGLTPLEAIKAATVNSSPLVKNNQIGRLLSGMIADIVVVRGNPIEEISLLEDSKNILSVIKDGKVEKLL